MKNTFVAIYHFFRRHRILFYAVMVLSFILSGYFASKVSFEENINSFLPDDEDSHIAVEVFDNLTIKDRIVVMVSGPEDKDSLAQAADDIVQRLEASPCRHLIKDIQETVGSSDIRSVTDFVYGNLPVFLDCTDYARLDSLIAPDVVRTRMKDNFTSLILPSGFAVKDHILKDPLGIASGTLAALEDFNVESDFIVYGDHIYSKDGSTLLIFISPVYGSGSTGRNASLVSGIEQVLSDARSHWPSMDIMYFGGPSVGVYNAKQIKKDTYITSSVALVIIILLIFIAFKSKRTIPLVIVPAVFGALFSLALIYFIKGSISAIAVGAGSAVLGIALSYSIHVLAHQNHVSSVEQLIRELAYPLTVGSFTTIGAFLGLLFTSSALLQDFGLFASLALVGTTLFCLVFLPQFLSGRSEEKPGRVLSAIEGFNAIHFEKKKWLLIFLAVLTAVCVFTSRNVSFDDDLSSINYVPEHIAKAEDRMLELSSDESQNILFVSTGHDLDEATRQYSRTDSLLAVLESRGLLDGFSSAERFVIPEDVQKQRIDAWNRWWTPEKKTLVRSRIEEAAAAAGFVPGAFDGFYSMLDRRYSVIDYASAGLPSVFSDWITTSDGLVMLISNVRLDSKDKPEVYGAFSEEPSTVVFDKAYFVEKWVSAVNDDFYLVLYISSILIFFALWLCYGRLELTLMSFLPMFLSWIIIIGIMGIFGMKFNIINIILSTFIFGIGDDFSIFIMDGLINRYKYGRDLLAHHKTAIFFSAFTILVGIGALAFAAHPALRSIAVISIFGIIAVVMVAYIIQPVIFNVFISGPASEGYPPMTFNGIFRTAALFLAFGAGCILVTLMIVPLSLLPAGRKRKSLWISYLMHYVCRMIIASAVSLKFVRDNPYGEDFSRGGILIANHQSFLDIIMLLALTPKMVMVTNSWVWHSPLFGRLIRYAGFVCTESGHEDALARVEEKLSEGYIVAIFPEGTRSEDGKIHRFHNGAFMMAEKTVADIIPVVIYGNWRAIPKKRPFYIRRSTVGYRILPRIPASDRSYGADFSERTKAVCRHMRDEYGKFCLEYDNASNPYFREALMSCYLYKGPVTEWYMRIKLGMEDYYGRYDRLLPGEGQITDIGCGMGALCLMMSMLSPGRRMTGIDYDEDKIALARNIRIKDARADFICADAACCTLPESDVFIMNDMLHYLSEDGQESLMAACASRLRTGGMIIVRDGDSGKTGRHRLTKLTELFSTRIVRFNRTAGDLHFISGERIRQMAHKLGFEVSETENDSYTSNTIYILRRKSS